MSSQRIIHVITRSDWGGAPRIVESLATQIDDITAVACGPGGQLIDRLENKGVPVQVQPHLQSPPHPKDALAYRELRQLIDKGEFDLVHSHSTKAGALARIAASRAGVPSVFTVHGWGFYNTEYSALRPLLIRGEQLLERCTDEIVCVSRNDCRQGKRHGILSADAGTVIHNGIPSLEFRSDRNTLYDKFGIDRDTPIVGSIGRIAPQKNPLAILETAKKLQERGHDFATVLFGSGPLEEWCHQYLDNHNIENTYMPGFVDDVLEYLPDFDVFLLPSQFEGFPLTVLECMHVGVPLVAHDVGGVAEAIDDSETGFVVPPDTNDGLFTDRVETLLENPQQRREMSQLAQEVAAAQFTEERMVAEYRELYQAII